MISGKNKQNQALPQTASQNSSKTFKKTLFYPVLIAIMLELLKLSTVFLELTLRMLKAISLVSSHINPVDTNQASKTLKFLAMQTAGPASK